MNATICDECGAVTRSHPVGWFSLRRFREREPGAWIDFGVGDNEVFCSSGCLVASLGRIEGVQIEETA